MRCIKNNPRNFNMTYIYNMKLLYYNRLQNLFTLYLALCAGFLLLSVVASSQCYCPPIEPSGTEITISTVQELDAAVKEANTNNGNMTIILLPGEYLLTSNLRFISENMVNLTIVGSTENKEDVYIKGQGWNNNSVTHIFNVAADNFTVANMTIGDVFYHPIQVHSNPADADNFKAQNVRFVDAKEQLLKVSGGGDLYADNGQVLCCEFEFTDGIAYQYYTGGIDAHRSIDWEVKYNTFKHIRSPETLLAEHAIHFWKECSGTIVDANLIIDCDRGIGFGLGQGFENGHTGGLIMNNMVHTSRDVGIGLETSTDTKIYSNTVITENYPRSIEYRFPATTDALISNNLVNGEISDRSSGSTGSLSHNFTIEDMDRFTDPNNYDYHLTKALSDDAIVGAGIMLPEVTQDFDCQDRPATGTADIGADQFLFNVATSELVKSTYKTYPNPSSGEFVLEGNLAGATIEIFNALGSYNYLGPAGSDKMKLDLAVLSSGMYFVKISKEETIELLKIVIKK